MQAAAAQAKPVAKPPTETAAPVEAKPIVERKQAVDGEGRPFITLAQLLKLHTLAESGGQAKALIRDGGITVNGTPEDRPGRKLHAGDNVIVAGQRLTVDLKS
jgi:ribosome-associated protein YbcJ (S4-like RNA binding protein)